MKEAWRTRVQRYRTPHSLVKCLKPTEVPMSNQNKFWLIQTIGYAIKRKFSLCFIHCSIVIPCYELIVLLMSSMIQKSISITHSLSSAKVPQCASLNLSNKYIQYPQFAYFSKMNLETWQAGQTQMLLASYRTLKGRAQNKFEFMPWFSLLTTR